MREAVWVGSSAIINWPHWAVEVCCILVLFLWELPTGQVQVRKAVFSNYELQIKPRKYSPQLILTWRPAKSSWLLLLPGAKLLFGVGDTCDLTPPLRFPPKQPAKGQCLCRSPSSFCLLFSSCGGNSLAQPGLCNVSPHDELLAAYTKTGTALGGPLRHCRNTASGPIKMVCLKPRWSLHSMDSSPTFSAPWLSSHSRCTFSQSITQTQKALWMTGSCFNLFLP